MPRISHSQYHHMPINSQRDHTTEHHREFCIAATLYICPYTRIAFATLFASTSVACIVAFHFHCSCCHLRCIYCCLYFDCLPLPSLLPLAPLAQIKQPLTIELHPPCAASSLPFALSPTENVHQMFIESWRVRHRLIHEKVQWTRQHENGSSPESSLI